MCSQIIAKKSKFKKYFWFVLDPEITLFVVLSDWTKAPVLSVFLLSISNAASPVICFFDFYTV